MRWAICSVVVLGIVPSAFAADYEPIRGSIRYEPGQPTYFRWDGLYVGGQAGFSGGNVDFGNSTGPLVANLLRNTELESSFNVSTWPQLGQAHSRSVSFGGFVGYNWQWENAVIGIEANLNQANISGTSFDSISRIVTLSDSFRYAVTLTSSASMTLKELGSIRGRFGWAAGQFMPYATLGFVVGRGSYATTATVGYPTPVYSLPPPAPPDSPPPTPPAFGPVSQSNSKSDAIWWGISGGLGLDVALTQNLFLRAEYEVAVPRVNGIEMIMQNFRAGAGVKF